MIRRRYSRGEWIVRMVRKVDSVTLADIVAYGLLGAVMAVVFFFTEGKA